MDTVQVHVRVPVENGEYREEWWPIERLVEAERPSPAGEVSERAARLGRLLDEWMADESGYDEATWPELQAALSNVVTRPDLSPAAGQPTTVRPGT